jgi:nicotinamide-nucleotide adenylyltransferase
LRSRAILIGRFQPFHKGHVHAIKQVLDTAKEVVIVIGSAQASHTPENPLTSGERVYMIHKALDAEGIDLPRTYIITVPDIQYNSVWPLHVKAYSPPFEVVYTGNPLVARLFSELGFEVRRPELYDREHCSGTRIRSWMLEGSLEWMKYVPESVRRVIEEVGLVDRLRAITGKTD